jgi:hypothetical protein
MAEGERQDKRPSCGWPVIEKLSTGSTTSHPCGSEDRVFNVKGRGQHTGLPRETPVCEKHLLDAWKSWNVDSADPMLTFAELETEVDQIIARLGNAL